MSDDTHTDRDRELDDGPSGDATGATDEGAPSWRRLAAGLTHQVPPDREGGGGRGTLLFGLLFSWLGFLGHQFFLYPSLPLRSDTTERLGWITLVLAVLVIVRPRLHALLLTLLGWGVLLLWLAFDSALPVGLLDLEPTPSFTLYAAHLVLACAQVPLVASAWGRLWSRRRAAPPPS
jgi:hypothetical protein